MPSTYAPTTMTIFGRDLPGIPDYPDVTENPPTSIKVPKPELDETWTHFMIFTPSPPSLITLPDPCANPALYAAAVDTIHWSNDVFKACGPFREPHPVPKKEWVKQVAKEWRERYPDETKYPLPPDLRTLYVLHPGHSPAHTHPKPKWRVWKTACEQAAEMDWEEKWELLTTGRKQLEDEYDLSGPPGQENFLIAVFVRWILHREYAALKETTPDWQPTRAEVDAFFALPSSADGVSLADIHMHFLNAKDIQELVRRVERFAVHTAHPRDANFQKQEAVYIRKPIPTINDLWELLSGGGAHIPNILACFPDGVGSEQAVVGTLCRISAPDLTTGHWILRTETGPDAVSIWELMEDGDTAHSLEDILARFPDRVWCKELFVQQLERAAYVDKGMWFRRAPDGEGTLLDEDSSKKLRALQALINHDPMKLLGLMNDIATWDPNAGEYVKKPEPLKGEEKEKEEPVDAPKSPERKGEVEDDGGEAHVSVGGGDEEKKPEPENEPEPETQPAPETEPEPEIEPETETETAPVEPPTSPKRKREVEDDGEEDVGASGAGEEKKLELETEPEHAEPELETEPETETEPELETETEPAPVEPPNSPKRKREVEDAGKEDVGASSAGEEKKRAIKKMRTKADRCAYPLSA